MSKTLLSLGVLLSLALTHVTPADACLRVCNTSRNGKSIDGLECQVDWEDKDKHWGYTNIGQICNGGYDDVLVHCPLMRTNMGGKEGQRGLSCVSATMVTQQQISPGCGAPVPEWGQGYHCQLASSDETGWYGWYVGSGPWSPTGAVSNTGSQLDGNIWRTTWEAAINDNFLIDDEPTNGGSYMLSCILRPPGSCGGESCLSSVKWYEK